MVDRVNQITSIHHFPAAKSLAEGQAAMRKTMLRREKRIHKLLRKADRVCFLCNRPDDAGALEEFLADFSALYPGAVFDFINIRDTDTDGLTVTARPAGKGLLVEAAFRDIHPDGSDIAANPLAWHFADLILLPLYAVTLHRLDVRFAAQAQEEDGSLSCLPSPKCKKA